MSHSAPLQFPGRDIREITKLEEANTLTFGCLKAFPESTISNFVSYLYSVNNRNFEVAELCVGNQHPKIWS